MKIQKKDVIIYTILVIFTLLIFKNFIFMHYSTDTYNIINRGYKEYAIKYSLNDGRPVMSLISLFADFVKMPINVYIISLTVVSIFISCISVIVLKRIYEKYKKPSSKIDEIVLLLICYVTIFNFMFLENMQFAECMVMSLSILFYIISAFLFVENMEKKIIKSILFAVLGILCYQRNLMHITCYGTNFYNHKKRR